ncbi:hypothetical protein Uis1B_1399 [Bifidobacterium margollesii]|uniref:Abasic site processing protein n=1 Tax=Bifidobacterium margollesii TaxID=2020964 RepID=A0A2N5J9C5_9BIFI|nr:SOS response-associated peptidase [Bifidobacterium margollesii]PLS30817.1 hypothetical protein Uis1B_1399 [Bifidobacterium margollesii]
MCRRFALDLDWNAIADQFGVDDEDVNVDALPQPSYNIAPNHTIALVAQGQDGRKRLTGARWSLVPRWSATADLTYPTYNARVESAGVKPTFADSTISMRAIIPASGYYEWHGRRPFYFHAADDAPLSMAGLYSWWRPNAGSPWLLTATIITCEAVDGPATIHDRMPMLIPADMDSAWLDPGIDGNTLLEPVCERGTDLSRRLRFHEVAPLPTAESPETGRRLTAPLRHDTPLRLF